jgi:rSAM/selenodomain-associated transferase 1
MTSNHKKFQRPAIIVMAKAPRALEVKTRLVPALTPGAAAALAACFACDVVTHARRIATRIQGARVIVAYAPDDGQATLEPLLAEAAPQSFKTPLAWHAQRGDNLGERLANVCRDAFAAGCAPVVVMGTDSPTLPTAHIESALRRLVRGDCDLCIGGTDDGGYYLIGLRAHAPAIFQNIEWSTARVYGQTLHRAARLGLRASELPRWYDVDEPGDLLRLREEFRDSEAARALAPATYAWLCGREALET